MKQFGIGTSSRVRWFQFLIIFAALMPLIGGSVYAYAVHQRAQIRLNEVEPRFARLTGLIQRQAEMKMLAQQASLQLSRQTYPATQDVTKAGNDAQQRIKTLFSESKLDIVSIQVLPPKEEGKFDRISIALRVEGDLTGIQNALSLLSAQTPTVLMDSMALQSIGVVKPASAQRLGGQFSFSVLRVRA